MRPSVMVSRCLLGDPVRYDGGHKAHDRVLELQSLGWITAAPCPEVEAGLSIPRLPIDLVHMDEHIVVIEQDTGRDVTSAIDAVASSHVSVLRDAPPDGFVFKSKSPSCGLGTAPVRGKGAAEGVRDGRFTEFIGRSFPRCPRVDETFLGHPQGWSFFLVSVYVHWHHRMRTMPYDVSVVGHRPDFSDVLARVWESETLFRIDQLESLERTDPELIREIGDFATYILGRHPTNGS